MGNWTPMEINMSQSLGDFLQLERFKKKYNTSSWTNNKDFDKNGFLVIKNLIDPKELYCPVPEKMGQYNYHAHKNSVEYYEIEEQVKICTSRYNYPVHKYAQSYIRKKIESQIGKELYNTYYFDRFYYYGSELKKHLDRHSCEISATVHISTNIIKPWVIKLKSYDSSIYAVSLNPGDAVIYKGCEIVHWRDPMPSKYNKMERFFNKMIRKKDDSYYHQAFFHYVLSDGLRSFFSGDTTSNQQNYEHQNN